MIKKDLYVNRDGSVILDKRTFSDVADLRGALSALANVVPRPKLIVHLDDQVSDEVVGLVIYAAHRVGFSHDTFAFAQNEPPF